MPAARTGLNGSLLVKRLRHIRPLTSFGTIGNLVHAGRTLTRFNNQLFPFRHFALNANPKGLLAARMDDCRLAIAFSLKLHFRCRTRRSFPGIIRCPSRIVTAKCCPIFLCGSNAVCRILFQSFSVSITSPTRIVSHTLMTHIPVFASARCLSNRTDHSPTVSIRSVGYTILLFPA